MEWDNRRIRNLVGAILVFAGIGCVLFILMMAGDSRRRPEQYVAQYDFLFSAPEGSHAKFIDLSPHNQTLLSAVLVVFVGLCGFGVLMGRKKAFTVKHIWFVLVLASLAGLLPALDRPLKLHLYRSDLRPLTTAEAEKCVFRLSVKGLMSSQPINEISPPTNRELMQIAYSSNCLTVADLENRSPACSVMDSDKIPASRRADLVTFLKLYYFKLVSELAAERGLARIKELPDGSVQQNSK